jgi:hypothetical protein
MTPVAEQTKLQIRQSYLRHLEEHCPRMAYALSVEGREGPSGAGAYRGTAVHDFFGLYVEHLARIGRQTDWEGAIRLLPEVYGRYPFLSYEQRQDVWEQAKTISECFLFQPSRYYGSEESFAAEVALPDGRAATVTGRLDYLEVDNAEGTAAIIDIKSNHQILPDTRVKEDFQGRLYALLVLENLPHLEAVSFRLLLSRYGKYLPQRGEAVFTRVDTEAFKEHLGYRLQAHFDGKLKSESVPGTWCAYCPLKRVGQCTLYRSYYGTTPPPPLKEAQARKLARQIIVLEEARDTRVALLKEYVNEHGPLPIGSGECAEVFGFHKRESEEIPATALMQILDDNFGLVGPQPLDELLTVKKTSRTYKQLRYHKELRTFFDDAASVKASTTFGHRAVGDE